MKYRKREKETKERQQTETRGNEIMKHRKRETERKREGQ